MAKVITQETFDAVVRENMEEFDMSVEEAIQDAKDQFEAQGVNLATIVQDVSQYTAGGGDAKPPLQAAIDKLGDATNSDPVDLEALSSSCEVIHEECDKDLAHRVLAAKNGAFPAISAALERSQDFNDVLECGITALCSLCNGQPDLMDPKTMAFLIKLLEKDEIPERLLTFTVQVVRVTCTMHEQNRQQFVASDLVPALMAVLQNHRQNAELIKEVCHALRTLTLDDDIRAPFGKAHDHAKLIVTEQNALKCLMEICKEHIDNKAVLGEVFSTLSRLAVRNEFCQEIMDLGGLQMMLDTIEKQLANQNLVKQILGLLKTIAGNDDVKDAIVNAGGVSHILAAMNRHQRASGVCELACASFATLALRKTKHCDIMVQAGAPEVILRCMQVHPAEDKVQKQACMAIRNMVARTRQHCAVFLELGAENLVQQARASHVSCNDEAKAALRDLGCKVELLERWTGQGANVHA